MFQGSRKRLVGDWWQVPTWRRPTEGRRYGANIGVPGARDMFSTVVRVCMFFDRTLFGCSLRILQPPLLHGPWKNTARTLRIDSLSE